MEYKFRAWSPKWNCIIHEGDIFDGSQVSIDVHAKTAWRESSCDENITLTLWTGLKDKNGKEIYEGDIIKGIYAPETQGYIGNSPKSYPILIEIKWHNSASGFRGFNMRKGQASKAWVQKTIGSFECLEVIGNIYENPELLTPVK